MRLVTQCNVRGVVAVPEEIEDAIAKLYDTE